VKLRRLLATLFAASLVVALACAALVGVLVHRAVRASYLAAMEDDIAARARLLAVDAAHDPGLDAQRLTSRVTEMSRLSGARITLIASDGTVLADSHAEPQRMVNHLNRPEVAAAFARGQGTAVHRSGTLGELMVYGAVRLRGTPEGAEPLVLRVGLPARGLDEQFFPAWRALVAGGVVLVLVTLALVIIASRAVGGQVAQFEAAAARIAAGDFARRLTTPRWREMAGLAGALNDMASQLDERMKTITRQANEQEAVLSSMTEGVIALDADGRIASLNEAACRMIGAPRDQATGRRLQEVVRNADLERLLDEVLERGEGAADEVVLQEEGERFVQVHCTVLRDAQGRGVGAVVVLNDLTRLRHLEAVRRDFVANVSHELKTPVTSIKGFVETLRDGAMREPESAARFLEIIGRQAERLSAIIDDLLSLSRLEQEGRGKEIALERVDVHDLLESSAQVCESKAAVKGTPLRLTCEAGLKARVNAPLLEQALVNLIDNAIKHSDAGSPVTVEARRSGTELVIDVIDHGCGIEPEHLPRLFERFYRVDRARSRSEGGTGLGLAIVKHITQAHRGTASVTSRPGEGSTFRMTLPLEP